jgi:hypothetical protein
LRGFLVLHLHSHCLDVVLGVLYLFGLLLYCVVKELFGDVRVVVQVSAEGGCREVFLPSALFFYMSPHISMKRSQLPQPVQHVETLRPGVRGADGLEVGFVDDVWIAEVFEEFGEHLDGEGALVKGVVEGVQEGGDGREEVFLVGFEASCGDGFLVVDVDFFEVFNDRFDDFLVVGGQVASGLWGFFVAHFALDGVGLGVFL